MQKPNLTYLVSTLGRSGPTSQLFNLISRLDLDFYNISVVTISPEPALSRWVDFSNLNVILYSLGLGRFPSLLVGQRRVTRIIRELKPHIIHSHGLRADWLNSELNDTQCRVTTQRNDPTIDYPLLYGRFRGSAMAIAHVRALKNIPYVVACSRTLRQTSRTRNFITTFIQNGIDNDHGQRILSQNEKFTIRKQLGLADHRKLFVWAGPFIPRKDPHLAVSAFQSKRINEQASLLLLGDGTLLKSCMKMAEGNENIVFCGMVDNVEQYLMAADGFISTSLSEGMPNSVLESLAWGVPVIISDIPAHREILEIAPKAGVLFASDQMEDLIDAVEMYQLTQEKRNSARHIISSKLNAVEMASQYHAFYQEIVSGLHNYQ